MKKFLGVLLIVSMLAPLNVLGAQEEVVTLDKNGLEKPELTLKTDTKELKGSLLVNDSETLEKLIELQKEHDIKDLEKLYWTNIEIANWSRLLHQEAFIETEKRLISRLYKSAEERYVDLLQARPILFQRVNLGYIASFLGISQVTLCHLRNKLR